MNTNRMLAGLVATLALVVTLFTAFTASPASAKALSDCPNGQGCFWIDANYSGTRVDLPFSVYGPNNCINLTGIWNNSISGIAAIYGSGYGIRYWDAANCTGTGAQVPHLKAINFPQQSPSWNDKVSSWTIVLA